MTTSTNVIPLRPNMPEHPQAPRHHASLEVWIAQARLIPTAANDGHYRWLSLVAGAQAVDILDDYEKTMDGLIGAALKDEHLDPSGFLTGDLSREAVRVALLAALTEEIAERVAVESAEILAGEVGQA